MLSVRGQLLALAVFLITIAGFGTISHGHELQPGYLELRRVESAPVLELHGEVESLSGGRYALTG